MSFKIEEVSTPKQLKKFIDFPHDLYKNDPNYVPELYLAQKDLLSRKKNPFFEHGDMKLFIAINDDNQIVGRIAGIYNGSYIKYIKEDNGFFGFFDVINDQTIANELLDKAITWVKTKVSGKIIGPANPTSNDSWGLQIEGFESPSMAMMPHNFPYYQGLLENYGFTKQTDLLAYIFDLKDFNGDKAKRLAGAIEERLKRKGITIRKLDLKHNFESEAAKVRDVYNKAWDKNLGSIPLTDAEFEHMAKDLKMIVDPEFCRVAEFEGKFIGISISIPNINDVLINIKRGRLFPTGIFHLLRMKKEVKGIRIMILGVLEEYRKLGIEACFYTALMNSATESKTIDKAEASWILEGNDMMNKAIIDIKGKPYKRYRVYEKKI